jgi:hypothetical protein
MPSSDFDRRYRLLQCVAEGAGVRSYSARDLAADRDVMVHVAEGAPPDTVARLESRVGRLPVHDRACVLETATTPAGYAVVTTPIRGGEGRLGWGGEGGGGGGGARAVPRLCCSRPRLACPLRI